RPNSIERDAVAAGVFPGGTKNTYDVLFQRTRGAVVPVRSIQATKRQLMLWADVCNEKTIEAHIKHLCGVGLLKRTGSLGDNKGQFYEVFTPDEIGLETDLGPPPAQAHPRPTPAQNMAPPQAQKLPPGGLGNTIENTGTYGYDKTSFKTNTERDDEEGFAPLFNTAKEIVGREVEPQHWRELAELLAVELKIAAGRTTVSSPAAFLTEHLRRRLWKKEKRQLDAEGAGSAAAAQVGKGDVSQCPDCRGTGMWYPEGFEKGVAKCRHEKLTALSSS
ncbi:MAG TPA: hypothetical protein VER08_09295, partial [Pyrinomonadaceae bacterium]|nr:hypothetical protein [Pyrinomonadaceae bacterium]